MARVKLPRLAGDVAGLNGCPYERDMLENAVVARPEHDVLFISPNGRELLWHKDMRGRLGVLHATYCAPYVEKVLLDGQDVTHRCRAVIASPEGGGSLLLLKHNDEGRPYLTYSEEFGDVIAVELVQGRIQVKFNNHTPLNSHSIFKELFDGENPKNPCIYAL